MSALIPVLNWLAPVATITAAMMTAANLGARMTGWGFAVFLVASAGWTALGLATGQQGLVYANAFLIIVNAVGVWRWLGREAKYEDSASATEKRSASGQAPSLFSFGGLMGADVIDKNGEKLATIVDIMGNAGKRDIAYLVVREGGVGGVGERLHAVPASLFDLSGEKPSVPLDTAKLRELPALESGAWPTKLG